MAVTTVQTKVGASNFGGTSITATFDSNNTAGNAIAVLVYLFASTGTPQIDSITDSQGNSYAAVPGTLSAIAGTNYSALRTQIFHAQNIAAGANTVTVGYSSYGVAYLDIIELTPCAVDQGTQNSHSNTALPDAGSLTPTANGAVVLCVGIVDDGAGTGSLAVGSPFTMLRDEGAGAASFGSETYAQATAASVNLTFTGGGTTGPNVCSGASFIQVSGATYSVGFSARMVEFNVRKLA